MAAMLMMRSHTLLAFISNPSGWLRAARLP
jgi:hypothetical protein